MNFNKTSTNDKANKKDLRECIVLWEKNKNGLKFYSGKTVGDFVKNVVAFITKDKKEKKQPDLNIYLSAENKDESICIVTLWLHESKNGKKYYSGYDNDKEKLIAFFNHNTQNGKYPSIRVYYKD